MKKMRVLAGLIKSGIVSTGLACSVALLAPANAQATVLAPGGSVSVYSDFAAGNFGAVLADTGVDGFTGVDFVGNTMFTGNFRQLVVVDTVTGFLDFVYQVQRTGGPDPIGRVTTINYTGFLTDVGICTLCADLIAPIGPTKYAPGSIDRNASGSTIGFQFAPSADIDDSNMTYILVIKTNATTWVPGSSSIIDGGVANVASFAPSNVPEPASMTLLATGLVGLASALRRRAKKD